MSKRVLTGIIIIFVTLCEEHAGIHRIINNIIINCARAHTDNTRGRGSSCRAGGLLLAIESRSVPSAGALQTNRPHEAGRQAGRRRGGGRYEGCTATTTTPPPPPPPTAVSNVVAAAAANDAAAAAAPLLVYSVPSSSTRHGHTAHACTPRTQQAIDTLVSGPTRTRAHVQAPEPAHPHAHAPESVVPTFTAAAVHNHLGGKESREFTEAAAY